MPGPQGNFQEIIKDLPGLTLEQLNQLIEEANRIKNEKMKKNHNPLLNIIGIAENCPEDGAKNHDKYVYGR